MRTFACALVLASAAAAAPQGGYTTETHPELGLKLSRARDYEAIPLQPTEAWKVLYYVEKTSKTDKRERRARPEFFVVQIDWIEDPPEVAAVPAPLPPPDDEGDDEGRSKAEPMEEESEPEVLPPINSLDRYVDQKLDDWKLGRPVAGRERDGYVGTEYPLYRDESTLAGWVYAYRIPNKRTFAVFGFCHHSDLEEQSKIWRYTSERIRFTEPKNENADVEKLERYYARKPFRNPEYRIAVRSKLVSGWKAEDTENYIVVYDTKDQPLIRRILREIEAIRREYLKLFPPAGEVDAVSTLRVCKSRDEYISYGGMRGSAGYWSSGTEELVMYDAAVQKGARSIDTDTFIVLYHEAFHQYIHYSAGALPPHSWFNEGHGDYFSGARISSGKVRSIDVNPWRIGYIQRVISRREYVPWEKIIRFEQKDYYAKAGLCYAQGWSMVYFLRKSKVVAQHPQWSKILDVYFDALKEAYRAEVEFLERQGRLSDREKAKAGERSRKKAVETAFEDVDVRRLQDEWKEFVMELEVD